MKNMKFFLFLVYISFLFLIPISYSNIKITEVMYAPLGSFGSSSHGEWVKLYNDADYDFNLSGFHLSDEYSVDSLECYLSNCSMIIKSKGFAIITDKDTEIYDIFNISDDFLRVSVDDNSIGNGLKDSGEKISLNNASHNFSFVYDNLCDKGFSIINIDGNYSCSVVLGGSLAFLIESQKDDFNFTDNENLSNTSIIIEDNISLFNKTTIEEVEYTSLKIVELFPNPYGDDNSNMPDGEFVEVFNPSDIDIEIKGLILENHNGWKSEISDVNVIGGTIVRAGEHKAIFVRKGSGFLSNEKGSVFLRTDKGKFIDNVSYSDCREKESFSFINGVWKRTIPTPSEINKDENYISKSYFVIDKLYDLGSDKKARFGDSIRVKSFLYKGDVTKSSVEFWIESKSGIRVSKFSKVKLDEKYYNMSVAIPLLIDSNCNEKYLSGIYRICVGWTSDKECLFDYPIYIEGISSKVCKGNKNVKKKSSIKLKYDIKEYPFKVSLGDDIDVVVELLGDDLDHKIELFSYIYRGSKSYSGERESNKRKISLGKYESKEIVLKNVLESAENGDYKLKVKLRIDSQKTYKEITVPIKVYSKIVINKTNSSVLSENMLFDDVGVNVLDSKKDVDDSFKSLPLPISLYSSTGGKMADNSSYLFIVVIIIAFISLVFIRV